MLILIILSAIRANVPSGCLIVLVGGKYLFRMNDIVRKSEETSKELSLKILAYFGEKIEGVLSFETVDRAPAMVSM